MRLSSRDVKIAQVKEHTENIGHPTVHIESGSSDLVTKAIDLVNAKNSEALKNITDIILNLDKPVYGEYNSENLHTIYINLPKIEKTVKEKMGNNTEEEIREEIIKQIATVIIHESAHQKTYTETKSTSEFPSEQAEKEFREKL